MYAQKFRKKKAKRVVKGPKRPVGSKSDKRGGEMYERRPLNTVTLTPPEYQINPEVLRDSHIEKEVRYAGSVPNVPVELDSTNRTEVLRVIDRGKKEGDIPWRVSRKDDAIFSISAHNVKVSARDGNEELLLRIPIHEIAAICYIRDDNHHILGIKYGANSEEVTDTCLLAVCYCDSRTSSEELCALVHQCFKIVYTDATMQFLDSKLNEAASMSISSISSATTTTTTKSDMSTPRLQRLDRDYPGMLSIISRSQSNLNKEGTYSTRSFQRRSSGTASESELSVSAAELLQDYMKKLHTKLSTDELRRFAQLLKAWQTNLPFSDFCEKVLELYGPDRKYLLAGMKPFIPEKDYGFFESFLERVGVSNGSFNETMSSGLSHRYRRTISGNSGASSFSGTGKPVDDFDIAMRDIHDDIENLQMSVHVDSSANSDSFLPKTT